MINFQTPLSSEFYTTLASDYDGMTRFDRRLATDSLSLGKIIHRFPIKKVLDVGCGTGVHSIILAQQGLEVTGVDLNSEMVKRAQEHARDERVSVRFLECSFLKLIPTITDTFDGIFCLGNSLPHILTDQELEETLRIFHQLLRPGGILVIQNLNYDDLLKNKKRILNTQEHNGVLITRFYDYHEDGITFQILRSQKVGDSWNSEIISTELKPWTRKELVGQLRKAGFTDIMEHGNLDLEKYNESTSTNLVLIAKRNES